MHLRIAIHLLLVVVMLVPADAQPVCARTMAAPVAKASCCTSDCHCPVDTACQSGRASVTTVPDKGMPDRTPLSPSPRIDVSLFALAPSHLADSALSSAFSYAETNDSPLYGGSPPQAVLRLWRV